MDLSPSGKELVVLTYKDAYSYQRFVGEGWEAAFKRPPMVIRLPALDDAELRQREALCFDSRGQAVYVTSEGQYAPIYRLDRVD